MAPTTIPGNARRRFAALDGIRGVAALGVAYGHFYGSAVAGGSSHFGFYLFVDLFFILSGFVLAHRYLDDWLARRVTLRTFVAHRFARLYPLHLFGLVALLALSLIRGAAYWNPADPLDWNTLARGMIPYGDGQLYTFVMNLLLLQNVGLTTGGLSWDFPTWSVSVEFFAPPLILLWISLWADGRKGGSGRGGFVIPTLVLAAGLLLAIALSAPDLDVHETNIVAGVNYGLLRCFAESAIGMLVYRAWQALGGSARIAAGAATAAEVLLLAAIALVLFRPTYTSPIDIAIVPLFATLVFVLALERGAVARALLAAPFRFLGAISYSIYVNHFLVVFAFAFIVHKVPVLKPAAEWSYFAILIGLSWITYRAIETPARHAINRRLAAVVRPRPAASAAALPGSQHGR